MTYLTDNLARWARYDLPDPRTTVDGAVTVAGNPSEKPPFYARSPALRAEIMRVWSKVHDKIGAKQDSPTHLLPLTPSEAGGGRGQGATSSHLTLASPKNSSSTNRLGHGGSKSDGGFSFVVPLPAAAPTAAIGSGDSGPTAATAVAATGDAATTSGKATTAVLFICPPAPPEMRQMGLTERSRLLGVADQQRLEATRGNVGGATLSSLLIMQRDPQQQALAPAAAAAGVVVAPAKRGRAPGAELSRGSSAPPQQQQQQGSSFPPSLGGEGGRASALDASGRVPIDTVRRFVARVTGPYATNVAEIKRFFAGWVEPGTSFACSIKYLLCW